MSALLGDVPEDSAMVLDPVDLLEKYGFGDGDMCDEAVDRWAAVSWPAQAFPEAFDGTDSAFEHPVHVYVRPRALLAAAVSRFLVPALGLPAGVRVAFTGGMHNPLGIVTDGGLWTDDPSLVQGSGSVFVSSEQVSELCDEVFRPRRLGWLRLMAELTWQYEFKSGLPAPDPVLAYDTFTLGGFVDGYAAVLDDAVLGLASELLRSACDAGNGRVWPSLSAEDVFGALDTANRVAGADPRLILPPVQSVVAGMATRRVLAPPVQATREGPSARRPRIAPRRAVTGGLESGLG